MGRMERGDMGMKQVKLTQSEARAILDTLMKVWIPMSCHDDYMAAIRKLEIIAKKNP